MCRGKHDLGFFDDYFVVKTAKVDFRIPYTAVRNLAVSKLAGITPRACVNRGVPNRPPAECLVLCTNLAP